MSTLDFSPMSWHIKPNGSNIEAVHRVTGEQFYGTIDTFNLLVASKQNEGVDGIDALINSGKQPALVSEEGRRLTAGDVVIPSEAWSVVSSRPLCPEGARSDAQNFTSRVLCVVPHSVSALKLVYANFYNRTTGNGECPFPNPIQIRASITPATAIGNESTPNVGYEVLFSGKRTKTLGRGALVESDPVRLFLTETTPVYIKTWVSCEIPDAPAAPTLAQATTGGLISNGTYKVAITIVYPDDGMESKVSAGTSITLNGGTATQKIDVTAPTAVAGAIGYRVWVTLAGGAEPFYDAGCGIVPFTRNAVVYALPNIAANFDTAEIVLPSTPMLFPISYAGLLGGIATGGVNSGEGSISGYDTTSQSTGIAIGGNAGVYASYGPVAVLGLTAGEKSSVAIVGDSIADGAGDSGHGGVAGFISRGAQKQFGRKYDPTINPTVGLVSVSQGSETPSRTADGRFNRRLQIAALARSVVCDHSTNSLSSGSPFIIYYVLLSADRLLQLGKRYWHTTCTPRNSSIDGFMTLANSVQAFSMVEGARRQFNAWLRNTSKNVSVRGETPFRVSAVSVNTSYNYYGNADGTIDTFLPRNVFVQGSETVKVNGVISTDYTYYNTQVIEGVTYVQGVRFNTPPAANAVIKIDYTSIPGFRIMRPKAGVFDTAANVEVNGNNVLELDGGWWPSNAATLQSGIVASAVGSNSITGTGLNMATDQYRGYTLTITADASTPASVGQSVLIKYNTNNYFVMSSNWTTQPSVGAVFSITDVATADGLHPSTRIHIEMAKAIDPSLF